MEEKCEIEELKQQKAKLKRNERSKRRNTQDMANYYTQKDPEDIFRTTLTGIYMNFETNRISPGTRSQTSEAILPRYSYRGC